MHPRRDAHALHPTCRANREKDLPGIWAQEQTCDTPRRAERTKKKKWRDGCEPRGTTERRDGDRRRREEGDVREELRLGGQMKWWVRNEVWKDSVLGIILFLVPLLRLSTSVEEEGGGRRSYRGPCPFCQFQPSPLLSPSFGSDHLFPLPPLISSFLWQWAPGGCHSYLRYGHNGQGLRIGVNKRERGHQYLRLYNLRLFHIDSEGWRLSHAVK